MRKSKKMNIEKTPPLKRLEESNIPKIKKWVLSAEELEEFTKMNEDLKSRRWKTEELLIEHNLLDKVNGYKDMDSCPLCEKPFVEGDLVDHSLGRPIHSKCLGKLRKAKRTKRT